MKKTLVLIHALLLFSVVAFSQSRIIKGQVKDEKGNIVPFATVALRNAVTGSPTSGYQQMPTALFL